MKHDLKCPRCEGRRLLHVREVASEVGENGGQNLVWKLARNLAARAGGAVASGSVEAWVCKGCGYTELYTKADEIIIDGVKVIEVDGDLGQGPYRSGPAPCSVCLRAEGPDGFAVLHVLVQNAGLSLGAARDAVAGLPWTIKLPSRSEAIVLHNALTHAGATADLV